MPEIADGLVEIANVAREPGYRSKIAVISHTDGVDPVGACVGPRGSRVRMVVSELRGEKIDIIPFNDEPARFVAKALSPARVREVLVDDDAKQATVIVPDDQLSLAIGREGQNARLAARLTGWRVDIRSETEFAAEEAEHGYEEEEVRAAAPRSSPQRPPLPERLAARLALLRPGDPPGARRHRQRQRRRLVTRAATARRATAEPEPQALRRSRTPRAERADRARARTAQPSRSPRPPDAGRAGRRGRGRRGASPSAEAHACRGGRQGEPPADKAPARRGAARRSADGARRPRKRPPSDGARRRAGGEPAPEREASGDRGAAPRET